MQMERNIFASFSLPVDDGPTSDESEISDEDEEWQPSIHEDVTGSMSSSSDDDDSVYTELAPAAINIVPTVDSHDEIETNEVDSEAGENNILGKDKSTVWYSKPLPEVRTPRKNVLKMPKNQTPFTAHVVSPTDAFLLYVNETMIQTTVDCTNREGEKERQDKWQRTDATEMKAFIGCLLHTGALHQNNISVKLLFSPVHGNPLLRAAFSMKRFSNLLNHIRFDNKDTRSVRRARDVFAPIRDIWELFLANLARYYVPGENITVDEQLVGFRGRCRFIQYMPSKPDKYGIKIFWACDSSTNYPLRGCPYLGKESRSAMPAKRNVGIASETVVSLTRDFQGSGRNVTTDNYFTHLQLAESMAKNRLTLVGTVKRNKTFLPKEFQQKKHLPLNDSAFLFRPETTLVSYQSKKQKNVLLLSTMHNQPDIDSMSALKKPEIVLYYNKTKGGVDAMDQMAKAFTVKRKTKRWPLVVYFNMIDLASIAARVVFQCKYPTSSLAHADSSSTLKSPNPSPSHTY